MFTEGSGLPLLPSHPLPNLPRSSGVGEDNQMLVDSLRDFALDTLAHIAIGDFGAVKYAHTALLRDGHKKKLLTVALDDLVLTGRRPIPTELLNEELREVECFQAN
jgi:hypothetical protein